MSAVYKTYAKNETKIISEVYLYIHNNLFYTIHHPVEFIAKIRDMAVNFLFYFLGYKV